MRFNRFARGRRPEHVPGKMNGTERQYAEELEIKKRAGLIYWYMFEGVKLRLADNTFYTPDFAVMLSSGELEMHEIKGFWQDAGRIKIKVAASLFPLRFIAVSALPKKHGGGWKTETFGDVEESRLASQGRD